MKDIKIIRIQKVFCLILFQKILSLNNKKDKDFVVARSVW